MLHDFLLNREWHVIAAPVNSSIGFLLLSEQEC